MGTMTSCCKWEYEAGRSKCSECGSWAMDLRCYPHLLAFGRFPTLTEVQNFRACAKCLENFRARMVDGVLKIVCENGHDLATTQVIHKDLRDYRIAQQEMEAVDVLEGLPDHLRALID